MRCDKIMFYRFVLGLTLNVKGSKPIYLDVMELSVFHNGPTICRVNN